MTRQLAQPVAKAATTAVKKLFTHYNSKVVNEIKVELLQTALMTSFFLLAAAVFRHSNWVYAVSDSQELNVYYNLFVSFIVMILTKRNL